MFQQNKSEKGQALILIALTITAVLALIGLGIDGGQAFSDRRKAQNASDAAALAAALAYQNDNTHTISDYDLEQTAKKVATTDGYDGITNNGVTVIVKALTSTECGSPTVGGKDITVNIASTVSTWFAPVIGVKEVKNTVTATARACNFHFEPLFNGNAIVALNTFNSSSNGDKDKCGIFNWGTSDWKVTGGGVFSNGCARGKGTGVTLTTPGTCVNSVGYVNGFTCEDSGQDVYSQDYVNSIMPPEPPCDGTATGGYNVPTNPTSFHFSNGIYCVTNFDAFGDQNVYLDNAVLYIKDPNGFGPPQMKYTGSGFSGTGLGGDGPYSGFFMIIKPGTIGTQEMEWRGNGTGAIYGTILAPTTVFDLRGNANNIADHSQLIGYQVETLGTADVDITYSQSENHQRAVPPNIQLLK